MENKAGYLLFCGRTRKIMQDAADCGRRTLTPKHRRLFLKDSIIEEIEQSAGLNEEQGTAMLVSYSVVHEVQIPSATFFAEQKIRNSYEFLCLWAIKKIFMRF